jgi:hypothetical protein
MTYKNKDYIKQYNSIIITLEKHFKREIKDY